MNDEPTQDASRPRWTHADIAAFLDTAFLPLSAEDAERQRTRYEAVAKPPTQAQLDAHFEQMRHTLAPPWDRI